MTIDRISRCYRCGRLDFVDPDGYCFDDQPTNEILYSTGQIIAATRTDIEDDNNEAA